MMLSGSVANAGWIFEQKGQGESQTTYIQNNMIRMGGGDFYIIFDVKKDLLSAVNPAKKIYWQGPPSEMIEKTSNALNASMEKNGSPDFQNAACPAGSHT